jgi:DNA-binding MarR family transcriptional regulator
MGTTCLCYRVRRAARRVTQRYDDLLASTGLRSTQLTVLTAIYRGGFENTSHLADVLGIEQSALSRNLSLLKRRKLVHMAVGSDRREKHVALTDEGKRAVVDAFPAWQAAQKEMLDAMGDGASRAGSILIAMSRATEPPKRPSRAPRARASVAPTAPLADPVVISSPLPE